MKEHTKYEKMVLALRAADNMYNRSFCTDECAKEYWRLVAEFQRAKKEYLNEE